MTCTHLQRHPLRIQQGPLGARQWQEQPPGRWCLQHSGAGQTASGQLGGHCRGDGGSGSTTFRQFLVTSLHGQPPMAALTCQHALGNALGPAGQPSLQVSWLAQRKYLVEAYIVTLLRLQLPRACPRHNFQTRRGLDSPGWSDPGEWERSISQNDRYVPPSAVACKGKLHDEASRQESILQLSHFMLRLRITLHRITTPVSCNSRTGCSPRRKTPPFVGPAPGCQPLVERVMFDC